MVTVKPAAVLVLLYQLLGVARFLSKLCVAIIYSFFEK